MTILLWAAFLMNLLVLVLLVQWLPSLLREAGMPLQTAITTTVGFNVGGVLVAPLVGRLMDHFNPFAILAGTFVWAAIFIAIAGSAISSQTLLMIAVFSAGAGVNGGQINLNALGGRLYPTAIRSTGIGWALGIGRIGAIVGPLIGGLLVGLGWQSSSIIFVAAAPLLLVTIVVWGLSQTRGASQTIAGSIGK